jgi:transcriptional regulator with XRE-family HTH domain
MYVYKDIGNRINYYRKRKGYNQGEFSKLIPGKRTQSWISSLESGRKRISVDELGYIAESLGVSINALIGDSFQNINGPNVSIRETIKKLGKIIPTEFPCYLQSELGTSENNPLMLEYSSVGNLSGSNLDNEIEDYSGYIFAMTVECYYDLPFFDPTDMAIYRTDCMPSSSTEDPIRGERIVIQLKNESLSGSSYHLATLTVDGNAHLKLANWTDVRTIKRADYNLIGTVMSRRTFYNYSVYRHWLLQTKGLHKEERYLSPMNKSRNRIGIIDF